MKKVLMLPSEQTWNECFNAQINFPHSLDPSSCNTHHDFWHKVKSTSDIPTHSLVFTPSPMFFIFIHLHSQWDIPPSSSCLRPTVGGGRNSHYCSNEYLSGTSNEWFTGDMSPEHCSISPCFLPAHGLRVSLRW